MCHQMSFTLNTVGIRIPDTRILESFRNQTNQSTVLEQLEPVQLLYDYNHLNTGPLFGSKYH
jgi:hypothetical protein